MENRFEQEKILRAKSGMPWLLGALVAYVAAIALLILSITWVEREGGALAVILIVLSGLYLLLGWIPLLGLKIIRPQEAKVFTLFGQYLGTIRKEGFYHIHPFASAFNPAAGGAAGAAPEEQTNALQILQAADASKATAAALAAAQAGKAISLKAMTLNNSKQKINDKLGNPIEIGIVVIWRVVNTAKAVFNVDNYKGFLSIQCDSALRNIARLYPYDTAEEGEEMTLRGSSQEVADRLEKEIQARVDVAGLEILEARITHLAYAPEIAAAMLQRQQAAAVIDARKMIVEGAVGMVEMALDKLSEQQIVELDEERKAQMVSNLLVVLCANRDAQPIVNSGSLY